MGMEQELRRGTERKIGPGVGFCNLKTHHSNTFPSTRTYFLVLREHANNWEPDIQVYKIMGAILIQIGHSHSHRTGEFHRIIL